MIYYRQGERILATKVMPEKIFSNIQQHYTFLSNSPATTFGFGRRVGERLGVGSIIALIGELGCGKTLFTKGICAGLGVAERYVNSPTFVLVNEYAGRLPVFHMDLYRLDTIAEEFEIGSSTRLVFFHDVMWFDFSAMWAHTGGQINQACMVANNYGLLGGLTLGFSRPLQNTCIREFRLGMNYFYSKDSQNALLKKEGSGYEFFSFIDTEPLRNILLRLNGSYFKGDKFLARRGDPLYSLNKYAQVGVSLMSSLPSGLLLEAGLVLQYTRDRFNYTYFVNVIWGKGFFIDF